GLDGGGEGLVAPRRPLGQVGRLRAGVDLRVHVVGQLDLEIHRGAPEEVARARSGGRLADDAVVELGAVHVVVLDRQLRIERRKILQERRYQRRVGRRVDGQLAFLFRGGNDVLRSRGTILRSGRPGPRGGEKK